MCWTYTILIVNVKVYLSFMTEKFVWGQILGPTAAFGTRELELLVPFWILNSCRLSIYRFWLNSQGKSGQTRGKKIGYESEVSFKEDDTSSEASEKHSDDLWHHLDAHLNDLAVSVVIFQKMNM